MMLRKCIPCFVVFFFGTDFGFVSAQSEYSDVSVDLVNEVVLEFGLNREQFAEASCLVEVVNTTSSAETLDEGEGTIRYDFVFHESLKSKLKRSDMRITSVGSDGTTQLEWSTFLEERGRLKRITRAGPQDLRPEEQKGLLPWHTYDPWMLPITDPAMIEAGVGANSFFWQRAFSETGLLWAEENRRFVRGEWDVGTEGAGRTRIQAYFDKNTFNLPVHIRYVDPVDKETRFPKRGRRYETDISVEWKKMGKGFVPKVVEMKRIAYGIERKVDYVQTSTLNYIWDKHVVSEGNPVDWKVFNVANGMIPPEELYSRFLKE